MRYRILPLLAALSLLTGCAGFNRQCEKQTVSPGHLQPLPPMIEPVSADCGDVVNAYKRNLATAAIWGGRYRSLIEECK